MAVLTILEKAVNPMLTFVVDVEQMSGDADAYNHESFNFNCKLQAAAFIDFLTVVADLQGDGYHNEVQNLELAVKAKLTEEQLKAFNCSYEKLRDKLYNVCGQDVTSSGIPGFIASVSSFKVTWYNELGEQFNVRVDP